MSRRVYPDTVPIERKFGYSHVMERAAIRAELVAAGEPDDMRLHFKVVSEQERRHKDDPTFAERCAAFRARQPKAREGFTREELDRIAEHFAGANDPVAISILEKARP